MLLWFQKEWKPEEDSAGADEKVKPSLANNEKNENINEDSEDHKNEPSAEYIESHDQDIRNQNALDSEKQDDDKTNHVDPDSNNTEKTSHNTSHSDQPETIEKVVIKCSECSQKLRVIKGKNLKINCPRCKQTFKTIT